MLFRFGTQLVEAARPWQPRRPVHDADSGESRSDNYDILLLTLEIHPPQECARLGLIVANSEAS